MSALTEFVPLPAGLMVTALSEGHPSHPDAIVAEVRSTTPIDPPPCAQCGTRSVRNGMRAVFFRDEPAGSRPVILRWRRQSWLCRNCGRSDLEEHDFFDPQRSITRRLRAWLVEHARDTPLTTLAQRCGLDERSARRILSEADHPEPQGLPFDILSLTTVRLVGRDRPVLVDPIHRKVVDVYRQTDDIALALIGPRPARLGRLRLLLHPPDPEYAALAKQLGAETLAVSRSDLVRATDALVTQAVRTALPPVGAMLFRRRRATIKRHAHRRLDNWERSEPTLFAAYLVKEAFYAVWAGSATAGEVDARYEDWRRQVAALDRRVCPLIDPLRDLADQNRDAIRTFYTQRCGWHDVGTALALQQALARVGRKRNFQASRLAMLA